ncbi:MAG: 2-amino-4-hydroxy-6-hydroxymethyldihydropteridine diphosphokinase [Pseudohongiellaceae bacterium]
MNQPLKQMVQADKEAMMRIALSIGSNTDAAGHIAGALAELRQQYGEVKISPVFESEAIGFSGDNFLNLVVVIETEASLSELIAFVKRLEDRHGRDRAAPRFSSRTLDIDILTYGDYQGIHAGIELPRAEITRNAFVLWPLAEVLGDEVHPPSGKTYRHLWNEYDKSRQRIWPVDFQWQG